MDQGLVEVSPFDQIAHRVRLEWGPVGAAHLARDATVCVVIDVLSFTTAVSVAADRDVAVIPYLWLDDAAADVARREGATLAVPRPVAGPEDVSLAPASLRSAPPMEAVVLPSPNGSTLAVSLAGIGARVVAASLRNRAAVGSWVAARLAEDPLASVLVVPSGERWPDDSLRPAAEDLWGAGGVVDAIVTVTGKPADASPEARSARAAYLDVAGDLETALRETGSGRELVDNGYPDDVEIAAELDSSSVVPELRHGRFVAAG